MYWGCFFDGIGGRIPLLRQRILRWLPYSGLVRANTVGAKNMASSSGWAISRHIRLLYRRGNAPPKGEDVVEDNVQKRNTARIAEPRESKVDGDMA